MAASCNDMRRTTHRRTELAAGRHFLNDKLPASFSNDAGFLSVFCPSVLLMAQQQQEEVREDKLDPFIHRRAGFLKRWLEKSLPQPSTAPPPPVPPLIKNTSTFNSVRMKSIGGATPDYGVNFTNTAYLSRDILSLKKEILFGQTPAKKMILQHSQLQENADPKLGFIVAKQWTLYSVTPLYKFSYGHLQEYSKQLSFFIGAEKQKMQILEAETDLMFQVKFSSFSMLKTTENKQAVLIQIIQRSQMAAGDEGNKVVWMGCFCCTCGSDFVETLTKDFTCLPLFLVNGTKILSNLVENWLENTFDCYFSPLHISPIYLAWMTAMWSGYIMDNYRVATELNFSVPCLTYPLDISFAIHPEDVNALWKSIHSTQGEIQQEEVELFMDCLYNHFHRHFKIHLTATTLVKVSTPVASAHSSGKIKIHHAQHLMGILSLLTELAISKIM